MTTLTQLDLNLQRRGAKRLVSSPAAMHAMIEGSFPPGSARSGEGRTLWRIDQAGHSATLYVVSPGAPDLTAVVEEAGWPQGDTWRSADYQPFLERLVKGQEWGFRLRANPVHSVRTAERQSSTKPTAHVSTGHQLAWLLARADRIGVSFGPQESPSAQVVGRTMLAFKKATGTVTLSQVDYAGLLRVEDPKALHAALINGIGRGKAYGLGLLTLARP